LFDNCPHAAFKTHQSTSLTFEICAHGVVPGASCAWHAVKGPTQLVDIVWVFIVTGRGRNVNFAIVSVTRKQISLNERLADIHMIAMHVILCCKGKNGAEATCMRYRAKCVFKISPTLIIFPMHMLALNYEAHFALFKLSLFTFDFIVETSREDFILSSQSRFEHPYPAFSACQTLHFQLFSGDPRIFNGATKHLSSMFRVLHATCVPWRGIRRFPFPPPPQENASVQGFVPRCREKND
jgi:hypothetical protein